LKTISIPFSLPTIDEEDIAQVVDTLRSGWLTTGPKTKQFESDFAAYIGCKHAIAVNSCTAALHLALDAIGVGPDDIVATTPMTFAATAEVIRYMGARPLFVDIDEATLNISPESLADTLGKMPLGDLRRLKAIIPVHMAGQPCDMDPILEVAGRYGIKVVEDAAHTLPARYKGRMAGMLGDIGAFSFYTTKCITTGEGGMVTTDNDEYAEKMRVMSLHGISKDAWKRYTKEGSWYYEIMSPGYKYNMPDILGALGLEQLKKADRLLGIRSSMAETYNRAFREMPGVELPFVSPDVQHSWHLYIIKLDLGRLKISRGRFIDELRERGVHTSVHFIPLHLHPYYRNTYGYLPSDFPKAAALYERILSLPLYPRMTDEGLEYVIDSVREILEVNQAGKGIPIGKVAKAV